MTFFRACGLALGISTLTGCASYLGAVADTVTSAIKSPPVNDGSKLSPLFQHLRVTVQGRVIFMALGDTDAHPDGPIEVYYSSGLEVLRLQKGHVVGAIGTLTEWRNVSIAAAPSWRDSRDKPPVTWQRVRDVMPGYRYGVRDHLVRTVITPLALPALPGLKLEGLTWFEERLQAPVVPNSRARPGNAEPSPETLPPARYAVEFGSSNEQVMYGEHCFSQKLCLTWQRFVPPQSAK